MKEKTCCFAIHNRQAFRCVLSEDDPRCMKLILRIALETDYMIGKGCTTFVVGMDSMPELWFAETVLDFKRAYPQKGIRLIVMQDSRQALRYGKCDQRRYERVLMYADDTLLFDADNYEGYVRQADQYIAEHCAHAVVLCAGGQAALKDAAPDTAVIDPHDFLKCKPHNFIIVK